MLYLVLVSAAQHSEPAVCIHIWPPSPTPVPPFSIIAEHAAELSVLYSSFPLAICFTHDSVFMSNLIFQFTQTFLTFL